MGALGLVLGAMAVTLACPSLVPVTGLAALGLHVWPWRRWPLGLAAVGWLALDVATWRWWAPAYMLGWRLFAPQHRYVAAMIANVLGTLPVGAPLGVLAALASRWHGDRQHRGQEWHPAERRRQARQAAATTRRVDRRAARPRTARCSAPPLAAIRESTLPWVERGYLVLPERELRGREVLLIGRPGLGKTQTLVRRCQIAGATGEQVLAVDLKGQDRDLAAQLAAAWAAGSGRPPRVLCWPSTAINGWAGDGLEVASRLLVSQTFSDPYWWSTVRSAVQLACTSPRGVPASAGEFLRLLAPGRLRDAWRGHDDELAEIAALDADKRALPACRMRYASYFRALGQSFDGTADLADFDLVVLQVDPLALGDAAALAACWMVLDVGHYATRRKARCDAAVLLFDELSAVPAAAGLAAGLAERVRAANLSVWLSAQSFDALGPHAQRLLNSAGAVIVHGSNDPRPVLAMAGIIRHPERTWTHDADQELRGGAIRMVDRPALDPNAILSARPGDVTVIAGGRVAQGRIVQASRADLGPAGQVWTPEDLAVPVRTIDVQPQAADGGPLGALPGTGRPMLPAPEDLVSAVDQVDRVAPELPARRLALAAAVRAADGEHARMLVQASPALSGDLAALERAWRRLQRPAWWRWTCGLLRGLRAPAHFVVRRAPAPGGPGAPCRAPATTRPTGSVNPKLAALVASRGWTSPGAWWAATRPGSGMTDQPAPGRTGEGETDAQA